MFKHFKRREIFEIIRDCAVNSVKASEANFLHCAVNESTTFAEIGIKSHIDVVAVCYEIERKIGFHADRNAVSSIKPSSTLGYAVSIFQSCL